MNNKLSSKDKNPKINNNKIYKKNNSISNNSQKLKNESNEKMGDNFNNISNTINELNEKINGNLNESFSKIAKINNKSISTDANVLSKIKFDVKKENGKDLNNNYTNINSPFNKPSDNYSKKIALYNLETNTNIKTNGKPNSKKPSSEHIKHNKNSNLSKILLESRDLIKKKKPSLYITQTNNINRYSTFRFILFIW